MADVTEVIHKISYEVNDEALINATKAIQAQIVELGRLQKSLDGYIQQLNTLSDNEVRKLDELISEALHLQRSNTVSEETMLYSRKLPLAIDKLIRERGEQWFLHTKDTELEAAIDEVLTDLNTSTLTFAMGLN